VVAFLAALCWTVVILVPVYFLVATTFRTRENYLDGHPLAFPEDPTLDNYRDVLDADFSTFFINNVLVTLGAVGLVLLLCIPAAYAVVRGTSRVTQQAFSLMLIGLAIPAQATIVPVFFLISQIGLHDTLPAVVLPTAAFAMPVSMLVLTNGLRDIPNELYEAQALDGAGPMRTLLTLVVPLAKPPIMTAAVFTALNAWNGFIFPLVLLDSPDQRVLTQALWEFKGQFGTNIPGLMAAVVLSLLPIFVIYLIGRRFLLSGLTAGFGK
jgi:raffinose/stachyose/melibiose transport system permease protein/xylobiose transport system permease protein